MKDPKTPNPYTWWSTDEQGVSKEADKATLSETMAPI